MNKIIKYLGFSIIGVILLFLALSNFSSTEISFECRGEKTYGEEIRPLTVYMKLIKYKPWIFWSDSKGNITLEIPNEWTEYYGHIEQAGDQIQIYETYPNKSLRGNFSQLSDNLAIDLGSPFGFFNGKCY